MRVVNRTFKIKKISDDYLGLIRSFLQEKEIRAIRYYISNVTKDSLVLEVSYYEE